MNPDPEILIQAMIRHEEAIGKLYHAFGQAFPKDKSLWKPLAQEEAHHAQWLQRLLKALHEGRLSLQTQRFHPAAIDLSIRHITQQQALTQEGKLTPMEALSVARSLETSLLEKGFLEPFEAVDAEAEQVLNRLQTATAQHCQRVQSAWADRENAS